MREILLQNFDILAISEFGSGTFGKTGTNTATLFLRRKKQNPSLKDHFQNRVNEWFKGNNKTDIVFEDKHLLQNYCAHIGINFEAYQTLLTGMLSKELWEIEIFKEYQKLFSDNTTAKQIKKKRLNQNYSQSDKDQELQRHILNEIVDAEKDKLYYFCLASSQKEPVLIVKSPSGNKEIKEFLGYEWSGSKGNEGIKYIGSNTSTDEDETIARLKGIASLQSPLINPNDLNDESKINFYIRQNFLGEISSNTQISKDLNEFVSLASLPDMLDFSRTDFDKQLRTSSLKKIEIKSKYELVKLGDVSLITKGVTYSKNDQVLNETKNIILTADNITLDGEFVITKKIFLQESVNIDVAKKLKENDCFICLSSGSKKHVGKVAFINKDTEYYAGGFMGIIRAKDEIKPKFLFNLLNSMAIKNAIINTSTGSNINNLSSSIEYVKIPLPPLDIQQKIVDECNKVDDEYNNSRMAIGTYRQKIADIFANLEVITNPAVGV